MTFRILLLLGALTAFGPLAIDFYLPAFPALAEAFATDVEHVQLSLASYFVGIALGQLAYGPLADRYGRRTPLLVGVALFALGSLACALAPSLEWLIGARFVQALGGCAGMVVSRAVVRDLCDPQQSARVFSQMMLVMGLAPILAPLAGGLLLATLGWQSIFVVLVLFGIACLLAVQRWLPETLAPGSSAPLNGALGQYLRLLGERDYMGYSLSGGFAVGAMFSYISGSPFIFIELYGVPAEHYGWLFGTNALGFILMAQVNAWLVKRVSPARLLPRMVAIYLLCILILTVLAWMQPEQLWPLLLPLFAGMATLGCILPNASACAMAGQGQNAGSASALMGCLQFVIAAGAASLVGVLHDGSALPMALVMLGCVSAALVTALMTLYGARRSV